MTSSQLLALLVHFYITGKESELSMEARLYVLQQTRLLRNIKKSGGNTSHLETALKSAIQSYINFFTQHPGNTQIIPDLVKWLIYRKTQI